MSFDSIKSASSSMKNIQIGIDTVSHNIANINTIGYKEKDVNFESVITNFGEVRYSGTAIGSITTKWEQGKVKATGNYTDLMLSGNGFFNVLSPTGEILYTRAGNFSLDSDSNLVNAEGYYVLSSTGNKLNVPGEATQVEINRAGEIKVLMPNAKGFTTVDQIGLSNFANPQGLRSLGSNNYAESQNSGYAEYGTALGGGTPTQDTTIISGALESSNSNLSESLAEMITFQRSYQAVSKSLTTANDIVETTISLIS